MTAESTFRNDPSAQKLFDFVVIFVLFIQLVLEFRVDFFSVKYT